MSSKLNLIRKEYSLEDLDLGEDGSHVDTADTVVGADEYADIALLAPVGTPGVLDNPVLTAVL